MDFKELLSFAKDNQSFAQKKFQRNNLKKSDGNKSGVSDAAVKAFLAKKEEQRRAIEAAERKKRIEAKIENTQEKKTISKPKTSQSMGNGKTTPVSNGTSHRNDVQTSKREETFRVPKNGPRQREQRLDDNEKKRKEPKGDKLLKSSKATPPVKSSTRVSDPPIHTFKKHRRRNGNESSFEWSGTSNDISKPSNTKTKVRKNMGPSLSFKDLMKVAETQKDKPVAAEGKKEVSVSRSVRPEASSGEGRSSNATKQNDRVGAKKEERKDRPVMKSQSVKTKQIRSTTQTVNSKNNVTTDNRRLSSKFPQKSERRKEPLEKFRGQMSNNRSIGQVTNQRSNNTNRKRNLRSIDEDLEQEQRMLERKSQMLKRKMQGADYYDEYDDCEDDENDSELEDFIDDEGEDVDYSRHIRNIFGYDRRRYRDDDDDDLAGMEANYKQITAEEARSARIGKLEDEIERRKEQMAEQSTKRKKT